MYVNCYTLCHINEYLILFCYCYFRKSWPSLRLGFRRRERKDCTRGRRSEEKTEGRSGSRNGPKKSRGKRMSSSREVRLLFHQLKLLLPKLYNTVKKCLPKGDISVQHAVCCSLSIAIQDTNWSGLFF